MLIAINETAIGAHWAQSTLDITWEFLKQIQDETLCEDSEAARLSERLRRLNLPNPVVRQQSSLAAQLNGRVFTVESGVLSAEVYNFMSGKDICPVETFSFLFNSYGCEWITQSAEESRKIFVSTIGSRFANIVGGQQEDVYKRQAFVRMRATACARTTPILAKCSPTAPDATSVRKRSVIHISPRISLLRYSASPVRPRP